MKKTLLATSLTALLATTAVSAPVLAQDKVTLVVNAVQIFGTLDPAKISDYTDYMAAVNLYDAMTTVGADGTILPELAESWTVSDDNLTYTFKLRNDATFQDGSPVEAKDVVYSIQRLLGINQGPSYLFADLLDPEKVVATDASTVTITLNKVYAPFLTSTPLMLVVNEDLVKENAGTDTWAEAYVAEHSVGGGGYKLESNVQGSQLILSRFEDYYKGWAKGTPIDEIRFVITSDEATVKALATSGELGMSASALSNEAFESIGAMPGYKILENPTSTGFYIKLNSQLAPTDDVHIRKAIALAMDYDTIREVIYPGSPMNGPLASTFADAYLDTLPPQQFDMEAAAAEVAQSGYADKGLIKLNMSWVAGLGFEEEIALMFKSNLDSIGFDVTLQPEPWNRITELAASPETTPNATQVFSGASYPSPDAIFYVQYHSAAKGSWASMEWTENPEIDSLIDAARSTTNVDEQNGYYKELQQKLVDLQSDVFVLVENKRHAVNACLQGHEWVPMQSWEYDFANYWWDCAAK